jgi:uncharacterized protein
LEAQITGLFEAISEGDLERIDSLLAPDFVFDVVYSVTFQKPLDRDQALAVYAGMCDPESGPFSSFAIDPAATRIKPFADGTGAVADYRSDGVWRESGHRYRQVYVGIFEVADGRISEWREYFDPAVVQASLAGEHD